MASQSADGGQCRMIRWSHPAVPYRFSVALHWFGTTPRKSRICDPTQNAATDARSAPKRSICAPFAPAEEPQMAHMPIRHTVASCSQSARTLPRILLTTGKIVLNNVLEPACSASGRWLWAVPCLKGSADMRRVIRKKTHTYRMQGHGLPPGWPAAGLCRNFQEN